MVKVKKYVITLCVMIITTMVALFTVSALTFWFKWQADKAMIGIIMTYVLAGLSGGVVLGLCEKKGVVLRQKNIRRSILQACFLAVLYLLVLIVVSVFGVKNTLEFSKQTILVYSLVAGSAFLGRNMRK